MTTLLGFLVFFALIGFVVGLIAFARRGLAWARIRDRRTAAGVTAVALLVFLVSAALMPTEEADESDGSVVAASAVLGRPSPLSMTSPSAGGTLTATITSVSPTAAVTSATFVPQAPASTAAGRPSDRSVSPASPPTTSTAAAAVQPAPAAAPQQPAAAVQQPTAAAAPPQAVPPQAAPPPAAAPAPDPRAGCEPSYPETCLRSGIGDYDCAGGKGDGPNYIRGPLRVTPPDPFDLDRDGDGYGCTS
ncbi:hypothetical protein Ga0074812_1389 [Parafrankia irregularis]|uniref:Excalibur calcium-binding domain-containing protein n=1 Tax=Parafrankia irregularis TaxID=795642 RepID=A0A0S4R0E8_9ACTN|nr:MULTISPECIES: hypothetical protein [Parafrankia]MBE3201421.1 hypothetical protein [Parafrankia sp. CH37]CUU60294.1 hypothetical protein Ga0074812_1389 [Parafrankia irregularis]